MKQILIILCAALLLTACSHSVNNPSLVNEQPKIYPDYADVTIPVGIVPLDFDFVGGEHEYLSVTVKGSKGGELTADGADIDMDIDEWHSLLEANKGGDLAFTLYVENNGAWSQYKDFVVHVSDYALDEWGLTYRLIAPGYEVYSHMGLYQRDLSTFDEYEIIDNNRTPGTCYNCHTSNRTDPTSFVFHARGEHGATVLNKGDNVEVLDTKTEQTLGLCVYPYWHPDGRYVAFSTNTTRQSFHAIKDARIEVFDLASDLQIYDTETHELIVSPKVKTEGWWETFPAFSADGKSVYYCTAKEKAYPAEFEDVRYSLCRIGFDAKTGKWGEKVDTLINADVDSVNIIMPKPSYDGKYIMYTRSNYGTFPIWHKEADLWLMNLSDGTSRPIKEVNTDDTESYHNWNVNSHWFVFSSRRDDGLYTRLYMASIDDKGRVSKPFLLPQRSPKAYYESLNYSYNVPDFTKAKVEIDSRAVANEILSERRTRLQTRQ